MTTTKEATHILDTEGVDQNTESFVERFDTMIIGQPNASKLARLVYETMNNPLRDKNRPIGVYYLAGPSRSGKSLTAKVLSRLVHNLPAAFTKLECGEYLDYSQVSELKGASPKYVGYKDPAEVAKLKPEELDPTSLISEHNLRRVRIGSSSEVNIVLLNEIEKSGEDFYKLWMGVFDDGYLILGNGMKVDFTNTIFILTSNIGMDEVEKIEAGGIGFRSNGHTASLKEVEGAVLDAMRKRFRPEFRKRMDEVVIFSKLTGEDLLAVVGTEVNALIARMDSQLPRGKTFSLEVELSARQYLLDLALADNGSVAELRTVVDRMLTNRLGREVSKGTIGLGDKIVVSHEEGKTTLTFNVFEAQGEVAAADLLQVVGGNVVGLTFQRRLERAQRLLRAPNAVLNHYQMNVSADDFTKLGRIIGELQSNLSHMFEVEWESVFICKKPALGSVSIYTSQAMMDLIQENLPSAQVKLAERAAKA